MAKRKNNNKSPSLNNKNNAKKHTNSAEAEFLKEEFANEYAERDMLIDEAVTEPTTLKEVDAPPVDLAADVNVNLSLELGEAAGDSELQSIENIELEDDNAFSIEIQTEENDADTDAGADIVDEENAVIPDVELTLPEESETESQASDDTKEDSAPEIAEPEVTVEISNEMVGFNFGEEKRVELEAESAVADESEETAINLSDSLKKMGEASDAPSGEAAEASEPSLPEDANLPEEQKPKAKKKKPKKNDSEEENDTTIVDAVAKEMENEARQTLIQRTMLTDSPQENEDEPITEQEESAVLNTDEAEEQVPNEEISLPDGQAEQPEAEEIQEYDTNESDGRSDTPTESDTKELITEEEYKRALAIRDKRLKKAKSVFDFIEILIFTLLAVLLVTTFFVRHSIVDGDSMLGTLEDGQSLLISDFMYKPECGDIVVVEDHTTQLKKPIVKRIIAVGGQTVKIARHGVYVDGVLLDEPYVFTDGVVYEYDVTPSSALLENETLVVGYNYYELVVPEGELFVMGDHRNLSMDSRNIGTVREDAILGKVLVRIAPFDEFKFFK